MVELRERPEGRQEGFLGHVFCGLPGLYDSLRNESDRGPEPADNFVEGPHVAEERPHHELFVTEMVE